MNENTGTDVKADLLETILDVIHGRRGQNSNEIVSLLALSNLLGIISFLNSQDLKLEVKSSSSKSGMSDLKEMATSLLGTMGGSSDKKVNPAMLLNLLKTLSSSDNPPTEPKPSDKPEKDK